MFSFLFKVIKLTYPAYPYFFSWLASIEQSKQGINYNPNVLSALQASEPINPASTTTSARLLNPYEAQVNVTDNTGQKLQRTMDVSVENSLGLVVGSGTIVNGTGYVSAFSAPFEPGDTVIYP